MSLRPARPLLGRLQSRSSARGMASGADAVLAKLGYAFLPGPSGAASDWVLRSKDDASKGFAWRGQEDYDLVGAALILKSPFYSGFVVNILGG